MKKDKNKRRSRRGLAVFLCLLALAPALALSARAADVDIMFSDPVVMVGETATVNVYSTADIAGVSMTLVYDTDLLTYTGASGGLGNASVLDNGGTLTIVDSHSTGGRDRRAVSHRLYGEQCRRGSDERGVQQP